jgi:hypothetical protein
MLFQPYLTSLPLLIAALITVQWLDALFQPTTQFPFTP